MRKVIIKLDEDTYRALVAFTVLNDTESFDLSLAEIMCYATMSQIGEDIYGDLGITSKKLVDKKRKQYASIDIATEE
jgi:hypothetical protein